MKLGTLTQEGEAKWKEVYDKLGMTEVIPDFADDNFIIREQVVGEDGKPHMGIAVKRVGEAYAYVDPDWETPRVRMEAFLYLHELARRRAIEQGLDDVYAFLPPEMCKQYCPHCKKELKEGAVIRSGFARKLFGLGWARNLWVSFVRKVM